MVPIDVRRVSVRFDGAIALDGVDLRIEPGELFLLIGPSGSGKTTLLRCIAGFVTPNEGSVAFGEKDVTHVPAHLRNAAMVFQSYALFPHLSVGENVAFGLRERRVSRDAVEGRVRQALDGVRMGDFGRRRVDQLSGGEQQRVALARALVLDPTCLLLDEPLANLDAKLRQSMREEIRRVCKERRLTAIYVTHDQKEALAIADRVAVMKGGRVLQVGTPEGVYRKPATKSVASFVGETNLLRAKIGRITRDHVVVDTSIGEVLAALPSDFAPPSGADVWVSIRPECLRLAEALSGARTIANAVSGSVESTAYLGEIAEHRFRSGSETLRIYELNPRMDAGPKGRAVVATVSAEDVVLLPVEPDDA